MRCVLQQKELLSPGRGGMLAEDKRVIVQMSRGQAHLPDLTVTGAASHPLPASIIPPCPLPAYLHPSAFQEEPITLCFALRVNSMLAQQLLLCMDDLA